VFYDDTPKKEKKIEKKMTNLTPLPQKTQPAAPSRRIDSSVINKYKVSSSGGTAKFGDQTFDWQYCFPRFDSEGHHVGNQFRDAEKGFKTEGMCSDAVLFGQQEFPSGGRSITVTEGFFDALAAYQLTGARYPNVAVTSAASAKKEFVNNFEYLDSFDSIIINFDSDEPGQKAAKECAALFGPGKIRILKLSQHKDANDYLVNGLLKQYVDEWFRAPVFLPDGLVIGSDEKLLTDIIDYKEPESVPFPWEGLNRSTYGLRQSELTLFLADTGIGKTSFMKEIEYKLLTDEELSKREYGVGFLHLEENKRDTALGLMSLHKNKPYHLPDTEKTRDELIEVYKEVVDTPRVVIWDHFGSNEIDVVLSKIRHMVALGCKYIVIDHLSIIVSDQSGDERKQLDEISTKLKTLTMNLNICVICVMHINRKGEARGSAGPEQVANNVIRLERDKKEPDPWRRNITKVVVEKCRLSGRTGPACYVFYNEITGRLEELPEDQVRAYEDGEGAAGREFDMMR
jgi:twinkle protein